MNEIVEQAIEMADQAWLDRDIELYEDIMDEIQNIFAEIKEDDDAGVSQLNLH